MASTVPAGSGEVRPDVTLDLLAPFVDPSSASGSGSGPRWSAAQAKDVREKLEKAVKAKKTKTHSLLLDNFSTISTHIQLASSLQDQHSRMSTRLSSLEGEIDPTNPSTSFLPPVISSLTKHFTASNRHTRASAHVKALKALQVQAEYVGRLEEAIWGGRGGEGWVVEALTQNARTGTGSIGVSGQSGGAEEGAGAGEGMEGIEGTKIASAINTRVQLYRSMLLEQLSEAFSQAVSLSPPKAGREMTLRVQGEVRLQQPRIPRPENRSSSSGPPPTYTLLHLLSTLSSLSTLPPLLSTLASRLIRDIVRPLLAPDSSYRLIQSNAEGSMELRLIAGGGVTGAKENIEDVRVFLSFLSSSVFPPPSTSSSSSTADTGADSGSNKSADLTSTRDTFLSEISTSTLSLLLDLVLIPSMPASLSAVPQWLDILSSAAELESLTSISHTNSSSTSSSLPNPTTTPSTDLANSDSTHSASSSNPTDPSPASSRGVIKRFLDEKAGEEWVKSRSHAAMEEVKNLVVKGWGGWDGMEVTQTREVVVLIEEEVEDETSAAEGADGRGGVRAGGEGSGVGAKGAGESRGGDGAENGKEGGMDIDPAEGEGDEDGWGLDSPIAPTRPDLPTVSRTLKAGEGGNGGEGEDDAWGFDDDESPANPTSTSAPAHAQPNQADQADQADDGWDFDLTSSSNAASASSAPVPGTAPAVKAPAKPVREAKKLGKRVAKAKASVQVEDDSEDFTMGSAGGEAAASRAHGALGGSGAIGSGAEEETGGWGWDDPDPNPPTAPAPPQPIASAAPSASPAPSSLPPAKKRVVTRQERRKVEETYLVSKACDRLLGLVERCLAEAREMEESSLPTSFTAPHPQLRQTALSLLDTFRALLPLILNQIRDVPTLSMQLSNDLAYLASRLSPSDPSDPLNPSYPSASAFPTDIPTTISSRSGEDKAQTLSDIYQLHTGDTARRLLASSSHIYESTLSAQLSGLMSVIDEAQGWEGVGLAQGGKRCEGVMRDLQERLGGLGRVWKVVLPPSTFYPTLGYLIDQSVSRITSEILALVDITEVESEKLEELLRMLSPLEAIFEGAEPPTSIIAHTPHWLKHLYLAELLRANLVDITYLHQSGALVDFSTEELVGVVKALFADSEKRDRAIEGIERGRGGS